MIIYIMKDVRVCVCVYMYVCMYVYECVYSNVFLEYFGKIRCTIAYC